MQFLQGDMRTQRLGHFDAVITIFNAIGHLTKAGFEKAIKNIYRNLNPGGLYVFDIFNADSLNQQTLSAMRTDQTKIIDHQHIHHLQYSRYDRKRNHLISDDYFFLQKDLEKPKLIQGQFFLQIYTLKQLQEMLANNGFRILEQCGVDGSKFSTKKTSEMLIVAQKVQGYQFE